MKRWLVGARVLICLLVSGALVSVLAGGSLTSTVRAHTDFDAPHAEGEQVVTDEQGRSQEELSQQYDNSVISPDTVLLPSGAPLANPTSSVEATPNSTEAAVSAEVEMTGFPFTILADDIDADRDGVSDRDEQRLATDPDNPDTDGDGFSDGLEVVRGYNPLIASPEDKVTYGEPAGQGLLGGRVYSVTGARLVQEQGKTQLVITGTGPAYSLVTLLVYSEDRRVWIARADKTGRFLYTSDDTLAVGNHNIYAAATDAGGVIRDVSKPLALMRTEDEVIISLPPTAATSATSQQASGRVSVLSFFSGRLVVIIGAITALVAALVVVGFVWRRPRR